jgi:ATP-dependent DNA helicase DinG
MRRRRGCVSGWPTWQPGFASLTSEDSDGGIRWVEAGPRNLSCHYGPVDVAGQLSALLAAQSCGWVLTSATLAVGEDFSHFKRRSGLAAAETLRFESPFDFATQSLLYLPTELGDPGAPGHTSRRRALGAPVIEASGGRAFLLFTSHRALRDGAAELRRLWRDEPPVPLLVQGEAPRDQLLRLFREAGNAGAARHEQLLGRRRRQGDALCVVVIDKLPFAVRTTRCSRQGSTRSASAAVIRSSRNRCRRPASRSSRVSAA